MNWEQFAAQWAEAAQTSLGFFWMALWAFILGYALSGIIQVFVTQERMQKTMGKDNAKSIALGTLFGFISSSCSFSALATTKSLFQKGSSFVASVAFLLASTNLVIELGIVISIFLGWQFVVGEYMGGILLILISWLLIRIIRPHKLIKQARERLNESDSDQEHEHHEHNEQQHQDSWRSLKSWQKVGMRYGMEWKMVWKDVTIGFTIAGIIAAFVPTSFFESLFWNSGTGTTEFSFPTLVQHVLVGPLAAFITFIGSMGNIPLAALLFGKGVSFAGVMAFIFSDLVVFPVLRINARYYGWKMSFFILFLLFAALLVSSLLLHYGLLAFDALPSPDALSIMDREFFKLDYTFWMNIAFLIGSGILVYLGFFKKKSGHGHDHAMAPKSKIFERILSFFAMGSYLWLTIGMVLNWTLS